MMRIIKRDLFLCVVATAFVIFCALVWGSPFVGNSSRSGAVFARVQRPPSTLFHGTVLRSGDDQYLLRDSSGQVFHLDDPQHSESFSGKNVTITGHIAAHLDAGAKLIHIERIELAEN